MNLGAAEASAEMGAMPADGGPFQSDSVEDCGNRKRALKSIRYLPL